MHFVIATLRCDRFKLYINGVQETSFSTELIDQNYDSFRNFGHTSLELLGSPDGYLQNAFC